MELTINKTVQETINVEDGFYTMYVKDHHHTITAQVSVRGERSMRVDAEKDKSFAFLTTVNTDYLFQHYNMVKQSDDTQFREALQNLSSKIENFY
jgi:hypothetical protein